MHTDHSCGDQHYYKPNLDNAIVCNKPFKLIKPFKIIITINTILKTWNQLQIFKKQQRVIFFKRS